MSGLGEALYWLASVFLGLFVLALFWDIASRVSMKKSSEEEKNLTPEPPEWDPFKHLGELHDKTSSTEVSLPGLSPTFGLSSPSKSNESSLPSMILPPHEDLKATPQSQNDPVPQTPQTADEPEDPWKILIRESAEGLKKQAREISLDEDLPPKDEQP